VSLSWDKGVEMVLNNTVIIESAGAVPGVINGLAVYQMADQTFGMPLRITARAYRGTSGIINVERESRLSGNTFNKAVMIISGLLGEMFAKKRVPGVTINLTIEQSYGRIDGDSASCAEFCAVMSSLARLPLRQDVAVTGSLNQTGDVQAVGGVNEKIEGFFRICRERGLTGRQGVIIPAANVRNLVLEPEVEQAIKHREFNIWAVSRIEEVVEIMTGTAAGTQSDDGTWEKGSVYAAVDEAMSAMSEKKGDSDRKAGDRKAQAKKAAARKPAGKKPAPK
jgi:predicted ATP-dependent protease